MGVKQRFLPECGQFEQPGSGVNHLRIKDCGGHSGVDRKFTFARARKCTVPLRSHRLPLAPAVKSYARRHQLAASLCITVEIDQNWASYPLIHAGVSIWACFMGSGNLGLSGPEMEANPSNAPSAPR